MNIPHVSDVAPKSLGGEDMRRSEEGASAVEFAILAPLLFMLLFGIIGFGLAFLQVQSIRTAVREGGRYAATGQMASAVQDQVVNTSSGYVPSSLKSSVIVNPAGSSQVPPCNNQNIGRDVTVSFDTATLPGGGVVVHIPLFPDIVMHPMVTATFRCEV
jgi:Flp pilus assembly protein TadG